MTEIIDQRWCSEWKNRTLSIPSFCFFWKKKKKVNTSINDITFNVSVAEMYIYVLVNLSKRRAASSNQYIFYIKSPADTV